MQYYQDISPWTLGGGNISVVTDNHHLGLVVSGVWCGRRAEKY